jgi:hypothetical protein
MTAMPVFSPRVNGIAASPASIPRRRARELRAAGRDVIELSSGNLDFATPDHAIAAALRGETRCTDVDGTPELKQAVRAALQQRLDAGVVQRLAGDAGAGCRGHRPDALLGALSRSGEVGRRRAGGRVLPAKQRLQVATRRFARHDHAANALARHHQPRQPVRRRLSP